MKKQKQFFRIAYGFLILILVLVIIYSGLQLLESTVFFKQEPEESDSSSKTITRNGIQYFPRQDITVLLLNGVDKFGKVEPSNTFTNKACVDVISLAIFDETNHNIRILNINRDSMADIPMLGIGGRKAGTAYGQIALSHTYGTGMTDSSENVRDTVSELLNGVRIDQYITARMDAVSILTDAVGGVHVNVKDDFSAVDPSITKGELDLNGEQAIHFVRIRKDIGNQLNITRMDRQKEFVYGFMDSLHKAYKADPSIALTAYDEVSDYIVTNCSSTVLNSMLERYGEYPIVEVVTPEGENKVGVNAEGEEHYEFHLDQEKLDELILRLFYAPK